MRRLTHKQERFVQEFLVDRNGAQAAIRAGYSQNCARETAYRLLTNDHIRRAIDTESQRLAETLGIERQGAIRDLVWAVTRAKDSGDALTVIAAWKEIALLLGFYPWSPRRVGRRVAC